MIPKPLPQKLDKLFGQFLGHIREWMKHKLNFELVKSIIFASRELTLHLPNIRRFRPLSIVKWINNAWTTVESGAGAINVCVMKQSIISTLFVFQQSQIMEDFIRDVIFPSLYHDFRPIRNAAVSFIRQATVSQWGSFFDWLMDENLNILTRQNKTESECQGALNFLNAYLAYILADPELFVRFMRGLFTMTFDSEWEIDPAIL
jgi:hypothetical protein